MSFIHLEQISRGNGKTAWSGDQYIWQGLLPIEINHMLFDILLFTPIPQQRLTSPNLTWHTVGVTTFVAPNEPLSSEFFHFIIQDSI